MSILVIAEHDNAGLRPATRNTLAAAEKIGGDITVLVAGSNCAGAAAAAAAVPGVAKVLSADAAHLAHPTAEDLAAAVLAVAAGHSHVLAPAGSFGKNFMPRVAATLDVAQISDIVEVVSADTFVRPIYAGNALAMVQSGDTVKVITVRATAFDPLSASGGAAPVEAVTPPAASGLSAHVSQELSQSARPELGAARVVVSGGRGLGSAESYHAVLEPLADRLGAALGASRAAVDSGYAPNDYQVGQTGKIVAPDLYIAVGLSGAIQHLAGMKDSKVIVAINKDADAPIFQVADYGLVGDLFELVPQLVQALD
ncbi:MAG: electron transfer flavoprotein subunit alpha/FixB family protein [Methyloversatilis discipulorum]|uniref:electron transfer flavoprotein subunit alpha/FixB family protein n=1 Tax=Methyloversatilis discipulorum TaxID=1119528 RepID=UPI0026F18E20|nr:FAD-binding protein [Methyloversatilis discipulorum]MBT9518690.1 electron transfer flavoprotein subunit alpha/FixB family protein [Methyloversatilis discipulorum]